MAAWVNERIEGRRKGGREKGERRRKEVVEFGVELQTSFFPLLIFFDSLSFHICRVAEIARMN